MKNFILSYIVLVFLSSSCIKPEIISTELSTKVDEYVNYDEVIIYKLDKSSIEYLRINNLKEIVFDLSDFKNVKKIIFYGNKNQLDLSTLKNLQLLEELEFHNFNIYKIPKELKLLENLRKLVFSNVENDIDFTHLNNLQSLEEVVFYNCQIPSELFTLKKIKFLRLVGKGEINNIVELKKLIKVTSKNSII